MFLIKEISTICDEMRVSFIDLIKRGELEISADNNIKHSSVSLISQSGNEKSFCTGTKSE